MLAQDKQRSPNIDHPMPVQSEDFNRCPTCSRLTNNFCKVFILGEMFLPNLCSRIEQRQLLACQRVYPGGLVVFMAITPLTRKNQVFQLRLPPFTLRPKMLD